MPRKLPNPISVGCLRFHSPFYARPSIQTPLRIHQYEHGCNWHALRPMSTSRSAINHLIAGTSTTAWLYDFLAPSNGAFPSTNSELTSSFNKTLVDLIANDKLGAAERLRIHLSDQEIRIDPHPVYEKAAIPYLHMRDIRRSIPHVITWLSLVPDSHGDHASALSQSIWAHDPLMNPFKATRRSLLMSGNPSQRIALIMAFGLLCISKGYAQPMLNEVVPFVIRFAKRESAVRWLRLLERIGVRYQLAKRSAWEARETSRWLRAFSVEVCCQAGWLASAVEIVQFQRSYALPTRTYKFLLQELEKAQLRKSLKIVKLHMNRDISKLRPSNLEPFSSPRFRTKLTHPTQSQSLIPEHVPTRQAVAARLRSLKHQLQNGSHTALQPQLIIQFLSDLKLVGGPPRLVARLRHRSFSNQDAHDSVAHTWIKAELGYHIMERSYDEILNLSMSYLDLNPPHLFPSAFVNISKEIAAARGWCDSAFGRRKLAARSEDRWMWFEAVIDLAVGLPEPLAKIQNLYESYLAEISPSNCSTNRDDNVRAVNHEQSQVLSAFIAAFGRCGSLEDARRVLDGTGDTPPFSRQLEMFGMVLARAGKVEDAMGLLKRIEEDPRMEVKDYDGVVRKAKPRLMTYGYMIEGFAEAGLLAPGLEVERMMRLRLGSELENNRWLNYAIKSLYILEMSRVIDGVVK